jgi:hypothetical protein
MDFSDRRDGVSSGLSRASNARRQSG